ncbi:MAG: hypothetical protein ACJAS1_000841 [Oleiphilaceae bacterium]|jgi:hypothetical protein
MDARANTQTGIFKPFATEVNKYKNVKLWTAKRKLKAVN